VRTVGKIVDRKEWSEECSLACGLFVFVFLLLNFSVWEESEGVRELGE